MDAAERLSRSAAKRNSCLISGDVRMDRVSSLIRDMAAFMNNVPPMYCLSLYPSNMKVDRVFYDWRAGILLTWGGAVRGHWLSVGIKWWTPIFLFNV